MKYLAFYDIDDNKSQKRDIALSVTMKLKYIFECLDKNDIECKIISTSGTLGEKIIPKKTINISDNITLELPFSLGRKNRIIKVFDRWQIKLYTFLKLLKTTKDDTVVVYHSIPQMRIISIAKKIKKFKLVIEIEEIYGDVWKKEKVTKRELRYFQIADKYIFSTELLNERINTENKPSVIIYGTYNVEQDKNCGFDDNKIHIVYAGTLDPRKGCLDAVKTAEYLDENYKVHILGYGRDSYKEKLFDEIKQVNSKSKCKVSFDGTLSGAEYIKFIQSCHIGLSPQLNDAEFNETSFPSKVLSYLSNGLRVVSIGINSLKKSKISDLIFYYDENSPETIAKTIKSINFNDDYNSREKIKELDKEFTRSLSQLIIG